MKKRLTRHLVWTEPGGDASPAVLKRAAGPAVPLLTALKAVHADGAGSGLRGLDIFAVPRDRAVYLLHIGAQIEHALLVQYLYAGYSLGGGHLTDPEHLRLTRQWRDTILGIAREEMGHLVTVENILTLIGGPLSFDREDYPIPKELYPFPFELERLTKTSVGKYVLAEMPDEKTLRKLKLEDEIKEIEKYVGAQGGPSVNRVGRVYAAIAALLAAPTVPQEPPEEPPAFIASSDIQPGSLRFQVRRDEWGLWYKNILIETAFDRKSAIAAINAISVQGEGSDLGPDPEKAIWDTHFGKFLKIYREFPGEGAWEPARKVARNPTTDPEAPDGRYITNPRARLWAGLLNLRYRMLLMYMEHSFRIEAPEKASGRTPRGLLVSWAFGEMYNLRTITEVLMSLPMHAGGGDVLAGPPFEMPYSLTLADRDADRWRMHRDLILASQMYVEALKEAEDEAGDGQHQNYLKGLYGANESALEQVLMLIGG